jgi:hypothetical protein
VILIPVLIIITMVFPYLKPELFSNVLLFSVYVFPMTLVAAIITGIIDGLYRFKSLTPPLLKLKIFFSSAAVILAALLFLFAGNNHIPSLLLSFGCLYFAVRLGLLGKKLLNVILPGSYPVRKPVK